MPILKILFTCSGMGARMKSSVAMLKPVKVIMNLRSSRKEVFYKKDVLKNFAKFTVKHLCQSLFFNEVAG